MIVYTVIKDNGPINSEINNEVIDRLYEHMSHADEYCSYMNHEVRKEYTEQELEEDVWPEYTFSRWSTED